MPSSAASSAKRATKRTRVSGTTCSDETADPNHFVSGPLDLLRMICVRWRRSFQKRERETMAEPTLLALALAVQDAHSRLVPAADDLPERGRFLILEVQRRIETLVAEIRARDGELDVLHEALADR